MLEFVPTGISGDLAQEPRVSTQEPPTPEKRQADNLEQLVARAEAGDNLAEAKLIRHLGSEAAQSYN